MSQRSPKDETVIQIRTSALFKTLVPIVLILLGATEYGTQRVSQQVSKNQPTEGFASKSDVQALGREITRLNGAVVNLTLRIDRINEK